jgi:hypothetical protein
MTLAPEPAAASTSTPTIDCHPPLTGLIGVRRSGEPNLRVEFLIKVVLLIDETRVLVVFF